jgi:hypothetical protein
VAPQEKTTSSKPYELQSSIKELAELGLSPDEKLSNDQWRKAFNSLTQYKMYTSAKMSQSHKTL